MKNFCYFQFSRLFWLVNFLGFLLIFNFLIVFFANIHSPTTKEISIGVFVLMGIILCQNSSILLLTYINLYIQSFSVLSSCTLFWYIIVNLCYSDLLTSNQCFHQVVRARKKDSGIVYALKIMDKKFIMKENKANYAKLERIMLDQLEHPGIVRLFFTFQDTFSLCRYFWFKCR